MWGFEETIIGNHSGSNPLTIDGAEMTVKELKNSNVSDKDEVTGEMMKSSRESDNLGLGIV